MGTKLMNCCKPEPMCTQGYGKMLKRIQVLQDGRVPAKEARNWRIEGQKRRISRKRVKWKVLWRKKKDCGILLETRS